MRVIGIYMLDDFRCQTENLAPAALAQLARDDAVDARAEWLFAVVQQNTCVVVEFDDTTVGPL